MSERDGQLRRQAARIEDLDKKLAKAQRDLAKAIPAAGAPREPVGNGGGNGNTPGAGGGKKKNARWVGVGEGKSAPTTTSEDHRDQTSSNLYGILHPDDGAGAVDASAAFDAGLAKKPNSVAAMIRAVRLLPIRPRSRGARRSLRTFPVVTLHPRFPFNF